MGSLISNGLCYQNPYMTSVYATWMRVWTSRRVNGRPSTRRTPDWTRSHTACQPATTFAIVLAFPLSLMASLCSSTTNSVSYSPFSFLTSFFSLFIFLLRHL